MTAAWPYGVLQRFERELLAWIVAWAPYGGAPDDETFPEFGLWATEVTDRATRLVCQRIGGEIPTPRADRALVAQAWMALQHTGAIARRQQP
jgi:hypothetical protein